jgi:hypothetical protein
MLSVDCSLTRSAEPRPAWRQLPARTFWAVVAVYHAALFVSHAESGRLFEPVTATRWLVGLALVAGLYGLRRCGGAVFAGRRAVVLWLVVILLHGHAAWSPSAPDASGGWPALLTLQVGSGAMFGASLVVLDLLAVALRRRRVRRLLPTAPWVTVSGTAGFSEAAGSGVASLPRPPPCG